MVIGNGYGAVVPESRGMYMGSGRLGGEETVGLE